MYRGEKGFDEIEEGEAEEDYVKFGKFYQGDEVEGEGDEDEEHAVFDAMRPGK